MFSYFSRIKTKMNETMDGHGSLSLQDYHTNDYCRLCANTHDNMVPIYVGQGAEHMLEIKIKTHLPFINVLYKLYI